MSGGLSFNPWTLVTRQGVKHCDLRTLILKPNCNLSSYPYLSQFNSIDARVLPLFSGRHFRGIFIMSPFIFFTSYSLTSLNVYHFSVFFLKVLEAPPSYIQSFLQMWWGYLHLLLTRCQRRESPEAPAHPEKCRVWRMFYSVRAPGWTLSSSAISGLWCLGV